MSLSNLKYNKVVGIGGIGTGMLFHTKDNATLGRSESRLAELSDAKDHCKLHIVFNYTSVLLGSVAKVYPIGWLGKDANGAALLEEIKSVGMNTSFISIDSKLPTMISICLQYPDRETCNFTASNSACNLVTPEYTEACMEKAGIDQNTIVAAIPEVQVQSRVHLIKQGKKKGAFCVLSIPESEAEEFKASGVLGSTDLIALNLNEAIALFSENDKQKMLKESAANITEKLYADMKKINQKIMLLVTCGKAGAYSAGDNNIEFIPYFPAQVINTTGAGDACLGGTMAGLAMGLPFQKGNNDKSFGDTAITSAVELGTCCAGMAVETVDTIATFVNKESINKKIEFYGFKKENIFLP